ncbi:2-amino-4-hydroxy-6-hydroxymethyldihydropteridine diphosphokinase [bacterium]|nr:2-amino-4-hydroxy-6-hydroxymethyldihydropteridine diphosphokinase [bacterium]
MKLAVTDQTSVYLALGSNLGDRCGNLRHALDKLSENIAVKKVSSVYETPPWGYIEQPVFYNQVLCGITSLSAMALLNFVKEIESDMGRVKNFQNGPRLIDIDILLFGEQMVSNERLVIPHPRMAERAFVLLPLTEIEPGLVIPGINKNVAELLLNVDQTGIQKLAFDVME